MTRRTLGVIGGAATITLLATAMQSPAQAMPPANPDSAQQSAAAASHKSDDRPNAMEQKRRALNKRAAELVLRGDRKVQNRGSSKAVRVAPGQWAEYGLKSSGQILSFLVDFGGAGPVHNNIAKPDPAHDNSTYWRPDFNREHYQDMFFKGMPEQNGESFKGAYQEMSSGRYTVDGDVSDWVTVPKDEASYGTVESNTNMTSFIGDSATAWYNAQKAAGKSDAEIKDYLAKFDVWDRYDYDGDGNFNEPDGYIDHFQTIHAGEGEEAGAPVGAIWSHRWAVGQAGNGTQGPGDAKFGGVQIGDTGMWIRDYTTEPENGGLGVFAHEFGHDLGLPDYYDTAGGDNGTAFWTLMSSGSWLNHGTDSIGTTPNHMGPLEKLQLGWLDYDVAKAGTSSTHKLGPSYHATKKSQALVTVLPKGKTTTDVGPAAEGERYFYSGTGDNRTATTTSPDFTVPAGGTLKAKVNCSIETDWDYAYAEISTDGGTTFTPLATNLSTGTNPNGQNDGHGITGNTDGKWVDLTADLGAYAGKQAQVRFRMFNDAGYHELGFKVDAITVGTALDENVEDNAPDWANDGFVVVDKGQTTSEYTHYYIAENRQFLGYDKTLAQGPYNFGWGATDPNKVERFPYQNGLLIWYWSNFYTDNNTSQHPGGGLSLPIDARATSLKWSNGARASSRIQAFDATFGLERTDPVALHREVATDKSGGYKMTTLAVPAHASQHVFDDTNPKAYYDSDNPQGSAIVAGTGTKIRVVSGNRNGMMTVKVN